MRKLGAAVIAAVRMENIPPRIATFIPSGRRANFAHCRAHHPAKVGVGVDIGFPSKGRAAGLESLPGCGFFPTLTFIQGAVNFPCHFVWVSCTVDIECDWSLWMTHSFGGFPHCCGTINASLLDSLNCAVVNALDCV